MDIKEQVDQEEKEQLHSIPAQRLSEKLSLLKNRVDSAKKRWFWELLQNASDYNESVNVKLVVSENKVTFFHDGAPFSIRDGLNIISPDSNKKDDKIHQDNIGKFGTGLVSTHILSSVMEISGYCIDDKQEYYRFTMSLNRECYENKQLLIDQIAKAKIAFKDSLQKQAFREGFNTSFSYQLGISLPDLPPMKSTDIDLEYLYDALPYTLCFMSKVQSVIIEDNRNHARIGVYKISRNAVSGTDITFTIQADTQTECQRFAYFRKEDVSSVFRYENDEILPYPQSLSRLFCGLPLIGTEEIGMPILLNSLKFNPTTEREGVEIEPSNEINRKLFDASVVLYGNMLDYAESNKLKNAFYISRLRNKYNGTLASNTQFYNLYLPKYKQHVLSHRIVVNGENQFIPFLNVLLPFKDSKPDMALYANCKLLKNAFIPIEKDYQSWFDIVDFTIFREQKYTYENLSKDIESKVNIYSFGKSSDEILSWLLQCSGYLMECDRFIFSKYRILPNQSGTLCLANYLHADINLPKELKDIYDSLFAMKGAKIGDRLLDKRFNQLNLLTQEFSLEKLAQEIDHELSIQYSNNQGNSSAISSSLNSLYNWISNSDVSKEKLAAYFHWYYPKRATLIVDMLSESQREQALVIAQSGKMGSLATLASSELTDEEIQLLVANIKRLPAALSLLTEKIDDKEFADSSEGDMGEELVYKSLLLKYPRQKGYNVVWASKERNEPCYDFEISQNGKIVCYCDAKTTRRGIANADSIPFFMRRSQWEFLRMLDDSTPYLIARVFVKDGGEIRFMRISKA